MKLFNYVIESNWRSLQPITHFKIHRYPGSVRHLVWWKLSVMYGRNETCERCDVETGLEIICQDCFERYYCECGQELCDSFGSPGDGFCARCR
jgi:hypothetical protein